MKISQEDLKHRVSLPCTGSEYWDRMRWCKEHTGEMLGHSDNIEGKWFHYQIGIRIDENHVFEFFDAEMASMFALVFSRK